MARIRRLNQYKVEVDTNTQRLDGPPVNVTGKLKNPPKRPVRRHDPSKTKGKDPTKEMNSMVDPDIDVTADVDLMKSGKTLTQPSKEGAYIMDGTTGV